VGIFAVAPDKGVEAGIGQFLTQLLGVGAVGLFTVIVTGIFWVLVRAIMGIRVSPEEEIKGLDIGEHAMEAYSGFVKEADAFSSSGSFSSMGATSRGSQAR